MDENPNPSTENAKLPNGRPTKFTPERCAAIIHDISNRIPFGIAAEANGICEDTFYEWLKIGKQDLKDGIDSDYSRFSENIKKAEREKIKGHCDMIAEKPERWQADAWLLERRWHKHFGPNAQLNELNQKLDRLLEGEPKNGQKAKESHEEI